ncbi:MAG: hypothetical protein UX26_C0017G0008 [Parcubacteria group bacterium GW2011_GWC1_45_9]|nr:MAG: hypothetical protein UX26_C0017G0008 [Parcubacteria group bacterium GW2011_GWC1_45_9]
MLFAEPKLKTQEEIKQLFLAAAEKIRASKELSDFFVSFAKCYFSKLGGRLENLELENLIPMIVQAFKLNKEAFKMAIFENMELGFLANPEAKAEEIIEALEPCFSLNEFEIDALVMD